MWPLALTAVAAATIVVWKLASLSVQLGRGHALLERVADLVGRGMIAEALAAARAAPNPAGRVLAATLARRGTGAARARQVLRSALVIERAQLERGFHPLAALATVAPLAGALTTTLSALRDVGAGVPLRAFQFAPLIAGLVLGVAISVLHLRLAARLERFAAALDRVGADVVRSVAGDDRRAGTQ